MIPLQLLFRAVNDSLCQAIIDPFRPAAFGLFLRHGAISSPKAAGLKGSKARTSTYKAITASTPLSMTAFRNEHQILPYLKFL